MSDDLQHECGVTLLRLRRNLPYYARKYGSPYYGYEKLSLLLEKQHNRGQDGAGIACVGLDATPGHPFYEVERSCAQPALDDLLARLGDRLAAAQREHAGVPADTLAKRESLALPFCGELYLGHLRYGTFGGRTLAACHPFVRHSTWRNHALLLAGNFNLTNTGALFDALAEGGHHLSSRQDSDILLARLAHCLEKQPGTYDGVESRDIPALLRAAAAVWDGGFVICGALGNGDAFALRDAAGIRPAYCYYDDEIAVVASERVAIQTTFDISTAEVAEIPPGHAFVVLRNGDVSMPRILPEAPPRRCVFERIYFSRGNDADIHRERRALGRALVPDIVRAVGDDLENTVFSYIPNTAQTSYHGLIEALLDTFPGRKIRFAQIAVKDAKFRTFISDATLRRDLFPHVYDVTYGVIRPGVDNLVVIDDSVVRGNTIRNAILPILDRLGPRRIVVGSAAPPICYPDCYGIDMASFDQLVAFQAVVSLLRQAGRADLLEACAADARADLAKPDAEMRNRVQPLYAQFPFEALCAEIGRLLKPEGLAADFAIVFQSCANLAACIPAHTGDWYFTGHYPTPGGNRVVNRALVNFMEKISDRAY